MRRCFKTAKLRQADRAIVRPAEKMKQSTFFDPSRRTVFGRKMSIIFRTLNACFVRRQDFAEPVGHVRAISPFLATFLLTVMPRYFSFPLPRL